MLNPPGDEARLLAARTAFQRVTELAPQFAGGYGGLAYTHVFAEVFGHTDEVEAERDIALDLASRALELDPTYGLAYFVQAMVALGRRQHDDEVALSERGLAVQPGDAYLNAYHAFFLATNGDAAAGIPYGQRRYASIP